MKERPFVMQVSQLLRLSRENGVEMSLVQARNIILAKNKERGQDWQGKRVSSPSVVDRCKEVNHFNSTRLLPAERICIVNVDTGIVTFPNGGETELKWM